MVCLGHLKNIKLIRAVLALTRALSVLLHASLVPHLPSRMLEAQNTLRHVRDLVGIVHHSVSVRNEISHVISEIIVANSRLSHRVELVDSSIYFLEIGCSHDGQGPS